MPVCENCQTPYDDWQHFCLNCGQPLKAAPLVTRACPRCGLQMALTYNYCHNCGAPLQGESAPVVPAAARTWLWGVAALLLFGLGLSLGFLFGRQLPGADRLAATSPASPAVPARPPEIAAKSGDQTGEGAQAALEPEVAVLLERVRVANLRKDIALYMDTLSALFPQPDQKRQEVLKTWEKFAFQEMTYTIRQIQAGGPGTAVAVVAWRTLTRDLTSAESRQDTFLYRVWFNQELGQWKIRQIEELPP